MGDVILFACGGAARHILSSTRESPGVPVVFLDSHSGSSIPMADAEIGAHMDQYDAYTLAYDNREEICASMRGMRVVIAFAVLGGGSGTGMLPVVARCAHEEGCAVVTVAGLPMQFESERRRTATQALPEILEASDRMIIMDIETINRLFPDIKAHHVMNRIASSITFSARSMASLMEGPFFSTFTQRIYTVAYTTDISPSSAEGRAVEASMFPVDPSYGKSVVMVSSGFGTAQIESIFSTVVSMTGIIPDIVKREDGDDTKVLTFLPVHGF